MKYNKSFKDLLFFTLNISLNSEHFSKQYKIKIIQKCKSLKILNYPYFTIKY